MNITSSSLFDTVLYEQPSAHARAGAKPGEKSSPSVAPAMPVSLWRHTQNENAAAARHSRLTRIMLSVMAVAGLGSIGYAAWQTCALLSGDHFQIAISAFMK